ncbi:protein LCHN-like [Acanthaster planci]|uniref:DENN domain-containing protein 11 n=1 Tax=Acanthaster planci TaxID=133434 RepID=A0A8B7ZYN7_ACAPL|nr:protein LCHN-like [Acanthaster planci]XP_022110530.1 protein LCHN-like [Acanthaster planci]
MASPTSDRAPLLVNYQEDFTDIRDPRETVKSLYTKEASLGCPRNSQSVGIDSVTVSACNSVCDLSRYSDSIVAIFVVAFDTRSGNIVEWSLPEDMDLEGVEFKAMASGSHTVLSDFIYFRKDNYYGLSCFQNMHVDSEVERGARMKSVGILATSYTALYKHMQFLENQVRHQLEIPGCYEQLLAFFSDHKASLPSRETSRNTLSVSSPLIGSPGTTPLTTPITTPSSEGSLPTMKITHPAGCFAQFINFFGEQIFTLWKYVLLRKRILFFSPPPIGVVCYRVYCASTLGQHEIFISTATEYKPFFYINVVDIEALESEVSYIACTTEKVFQEKDSLYDVYVDNQNVSAHSANLKTMAKINSMDKEKFNRLNNHRCAMMFRAQELGEELDDDQTFASFFLEQNNHIFQTLLDVSESQDKALTTDHMKAMGLDPIHDRQFIMDLVELYGIDVILMVDNPCCPV